MDLTYQLMDQTAVVSTMGQTGTKRDAGTQNESDGGFDNMVRQMRQDKASGKPDTGKQAPGTPRGASAKSAEADVETDEAPDGEQVVMAAAMMFQAIPQPRQEIVFLDEEGEVPVEAVELPTQELHADDRPLPELQTRPVRERISVTDLPRMTDERPIVREEEAPVMDFAPMMETAAAPVTVEMPVFTETVSEAVQEVTAEQSAEIPVFTGPVAQQPTEQPAETPVVHVSAEPRMAAPVFVSAAEQPSEQPVELPVAEVPAEQPVEIPVAEVPAEAPVQRPVMMPAAEQTTEQPVEIPVNEVPVQRPAVVPATDSAAEQPKELPVPEITVEQQPVQTAVKLPVKETEAVTDMSQQKQPELSETPKAFAYAPAEDRATPTFRVMPVNMAAAREMTSMNLGYSRTDEDVSLPAEDESDEELSGLPQVDAPVFGTTYTAPVKVAETVREPLELEAEDAAEELGARIESVLATDTGDTRVELKLSPENLGTLTVEITHHADGSLHVLLNASTARAAALLEKNVSGLQSLLSANERPQTTVAVRASESGAQQQFLNPNDQNDNARQQQQQQQQQQQRQFRRDALRVEDFMSRLRLGLVSLDAAI